MFALARFINSDAIRSVPVTRIASYYTMSSFQETQTSPDPPSPSSAVSDKENQLADSAPSRKRSLAQTGTSSASKSNQAVNKRRRSGISSSQNASQSQLSESQRLRDKDIYDPDQDVEERRRIRKGLRDLSRELHGMVSCFRLLEAHAFIAIRVVFFNEFG